MSQPPVNDPNGWPAQWNPGRRHRVPPISPVTEKLVRRTAFTGSGWSCSFSAVSQGYTC